MTTPSLCPSPPKPAVLCEPVCAPVCGTHEELVKSTIFDMRNNIILWFVIIAVIIGVVLALAKPDAVKMRDQNGNITDQLDWGKIILASIVGSLIIMLIAYLLGFFR